MTVPSPSRKSLPESGEELPVGRPALNPRPMGDRAILIRLTNPPNINSHAGFGAEERYTRLLLARATAEYFINLRPEWEGQLVTGYDNVLIPLLSPAEKLSTLQGWFTEQAAQPEFLAWLKLYLHDSRTKVTPLHRVPVVYGGKYGPDLEEVAQLKNLTPAEVIATHSAAIYTVYMVGFAAGYAYMGALPPELDLPRIARPRTRVPRGTVALAAGMTGVYPLDMPGGWRLLGYTPLSVFDPAQYPPVRFLAGERVQFFPIEAEALPEYEAHPNDFSSSRAAENE